MTQGHINIIDATPIEAVQSGPMNGTDGKPTRDSEVGWHVKNDNRGIKKSTYGFSVHPGVDEDGFIHRQSVTPGNDHNSQERDTLLLGDETALYADAAYSSEETREKLKRYGIQDQVLRKGCRNKPLSHNDQLRNRMIASTRSGGERPFATHKQHYGLARTRFMGLAKNATFYGLDAIAANIRKDAMFLMRYGLLDRCVFYINFKQAFSMLLSEFVFKKMQSAVNTLLPKNFSVMLITYYIYQELNITI